MRDGLDRLRALTPAEALRRAGAAERGRGRWGPCPACGDDRRRGAVLVSARAWTCQVCHASGDAIATAAILATGDRRARGDWGAVVTWAETHGWITDDGIAVPPPPPVETVHGTLPDYPEEVATESTAWRRHLRDTDAPVVAAVASHAVAAGYPDAEAVHEARSYHEAREASVARDRAEASRLARSARAWRAAGVEEVARVLAATAWRLWIRSATRSESRQRPRRAWYR